MIEILLNLPLILSVIIFPFIRPINIIQCILILSTLSNEYVAAGVMFIGLLICVFKLRSNKIFSFESNNLLYYLIWLIYSFITIVFVSDLFRFITEFLQLILIISYMYLYRYIIDDTNKFYKILKSLIFTGLITTLICIFTYFKEGEVNNNYYAFIILICNVIIPICIFDITKLKEFMKLLLLVSIAIIGINVNDSRASLLLVFISIFIRFFILIRFNKTLKIAIVIFGLIIGYIAGLYIYNSSDDNILKSVSDTERNFSNLERIALINYSYQLFIDNPLGYGLGSSNEIFLKTNFTEGVYPHPHNSLAHIAVELGFIGVLIFILTFVKLNRSIVALKNGISLDQLKLYNLGILIFYNLLLFSLIEDFYFNGILSFYCLSFVGLILAINPLYFRKVAA